MLHLEYFAEFFGWTAFFIGILAFQFKVGKNIILTQIPSNIFYVIHMLLIGASAGAITSLCLIFRNTLAIFLVQRQIKYLVFMMIPVVLSLVFLFGESPYGFLCAFGNILAGFSIIYRERTLPLRGLQLLSQIFFLTYGIIVGSYPLALMGLVSISSNILGAIRHEDLLSLIGGNTRRNININRVLCC